LSVTCFLSAAMISAGPGCQRNGVSGDAKTLPTIATLNENRGFLYTFTFSPDGKTLACSNSGNRKNYGPLITFWDVVKLKERNILKSPFADAALTFSPNGKELAYGESYKKIKILKYDSLNEVATLQGAVDSVGLLTYAPDGKTLASGG